MSVFADLPSFGFGSAAIGRPHVDAAAARACVEEAWQLGVRYFDTAPMYGAGRAEQRLGQVLGQLPRDEYVLSSKVGKLVRPDHDGWDYNFSRDGVLRSFEHSLQRLGVDRLDIVYLHDPDDHWVEAIGQAWPVLADLREQGAVRAVGVGMTQAPMLARFVQEASVDGVLMAGGYSLLDTSALTTLLPQCAARGVAVVIAQALAGGLIDGVPEPMLHYRPVDAATRARVERIAAICHRNGVPTAAAAIQFPLAHPAVRTVLVGPESTAQLREDHDWSLQAVPDAVWADLRAAGLLDAAAPTPRSGVTA